MAEQKTFELLGASGGRDENGICSVSVPYYAETFADVFSVGAASYGGLPQVSRTFQANPDGTFTVHVTYSGTNDPASLPGRDKPTYSLQSTFEEEAIEAHPRINEIVATYGGTWSDGKVTFPSKMPLDTSAKDSRGFSRKPDTAETAKANPMSGVEKYKKLSVQWSVQYAAEEIPSSVLATVGKCVSSPPGNPPKIEGRTKWLIMPVTANKKGNVAEITENYFLLDEDIAPELYK